ncbi:LacI family transcriptional regulator [Isoptericola sp. 4D.3]|uniref:LacI family transcriptional regulator n=1 Tax=Isoptericola peretonis TaxID=2918523 RepID=A0ABT0J1S1_9MICO|nr:LacI family transcriptional regulator [Isoptericola sp. 4D.3]
MVAIAWLDTRVEPTIYDVARAAGVAASTVSRAFNKPGRVNAATRERIMSAASGLGYAHRPQSRALPAGGRHRTIAMVLSDITNPHFFELIRGAEQRVKAADATLVIVNAEESERIEEAQVRDLSAAVDGFVLASSRLHDERLRELAEHHRVVLLNREAPGLASVALDTTSGCRQILQHLASLGHRSLTYCAGPPGSWMGAARWAALSAGAEEHGLTAHRVGPYTPNVANGGAAGDGALRTDATAFVAHNDLLAIGIVRRLAQRGVRVPDDVSVIGFDDIFAAEYVHPSLTTLGGPGAHAGRLAVELLIDQFAGVAARDTEQIRLPTQLVLRESSGPAA